STHAAGRAPTLGGSHNADAIKSDSSKLKILQARDKWATFSKFEIFGATTATGGISRVETRLEKENAHMREQLKFQGAVLDRLAGDVHKLESEAAAATGAALHVRSSSIHNQETKDGKSESTRRGVEDETQADAVLGGDKKTNNSFQHVQEPCKHARGGLAEYDQGRSSSSHTGRNHHESGGAICEEGQEPSRVSASGHLRSSDEEAGSQIALPTGLMSGEHERLNDNAQLRIELRETEKLVEASREAIVAFQMTVEEKEQSHVDLLSRERKFRAAVEAGLREKVVAANSIHFE
ncbi:unnamed protein product, partial [Hapterophycus canaliculatus]